MIPFFGRPYRTVDGAVPRGTAGRHHRPGRRTAAAGGSVEQWADSTDVLSSPGRRAALQAAYRALDDAG